MKIEDMDTPLLRAQYRQYQVQSLSLDLASVRFVGDFNGLVLAKMFNLDVRHTPYWFVKTAQAVYEDLLWDAVKQEIDNEI